jgi:hypothetical protein
MPPMRWNRPSSLGKTVEAKATNRPVKIAYLVPFGDEPNTHMILDAVFFESYTRWAGAYTLVIPTLVEGFLEDSYSEWLKHYDPDFVYSYVDLNISFIEKIDYLCCPIAFLKNSTLKSKDRKIDWRTFLPSWDHYIYPVPSISTVQSPSNYLQLPNVERPREPTVFTQYRMDHPNRFLADNFGTGFHLYNATQAISGFFKTLCLTPIDLPENIVVGSERCFSTLEAFRAISERKANPISEFAMINSGGMPRFETRNWTSSFRLFVGNNPIDRIHFWNCRQLGNSWNDTSNALIVEPEFFDDMELVKQLGEYLNKHNVLGPGNGPYHAEFHSSSVPVETLNSLREKLQPYTWNVISVSRTFNAPAIPSKKNLEERPYGNPTDTTTIKLTEDFSEITATEPAHFAYIPVQLRGLASGQWVVELNVERHNNLSIYSNIVDSWTLPRSLKIVRAFTERPAKPTLDGRLALVPSSKRNLLRNAAKKDPISYEINLPSDEVFFRYLSLNYLQYPNDDLRALVLRSGYKDLAVSDKGQNLRGVISLLGQLPMAYGILTNKYWRSVLAEVKADKPKPLTFDFDKLSSLIPNNRGTIQRLTQQLNFDKPSETRSYLSASLIDTLEYLIRKNVFYQVAHWRCNFCGHFNSRSFDNMKIKNSCDICKTEYFAPFDINWKYELNDFVYRSLEKHSGLPVLWTLGFLQERIQGRSFWYLPEVDLYHSDEDKENKNEIDILAVLDGVFYAVEAKRNASVFLNKTGNVEKFINMVKLLRPDIALLSFEGYCRKEEDLDETKTKLAEISEYINASISPWSKLEIVIASEIESYDTFPTDLGWSGQRVRSYI